MRWRETKNEWLKVARLGTRDVGVPHVFLGRHGWWLRFSPDPRKDDR